LKVHWQGGDHTELSVVKNRPGAHRWTTAIEVEQLLTELARLLPDSSIASLLNRLGHRTGKGHTWTETSVRSFRTSHHVAVYRQGEREDRGELTLEQAAQQLQTSTMTVLRMISAGALVARQVCKGAPWVIKRSDLARCESHRSGQPGQKGPLTADPNQIPLQFQ
jgi:excisionase family DNA binding protein